MILRKDQQQLKNKINKKIKNGVRNEGKITNLLKNVVKVVIVYIETETLLFFFYQLIGYMV